MSAHHSDETRWNNRVRPPLPTPKSLTNGKTEIAVAYSVVSKERRKPPLPTPKETEEKPNTGTSPSPSSPARSIPPAIPRRSSSRSMSSDKEVVVSPAMPLTHFVLKYSRKLPVQIKVMRGYCGPSSRLTISTDDMYNIHLVKHTKVIRIKDIHSNSYSIPLNSSVEIGLVFDPIKNSRGSNEAVTGFKLRVSDIVTLDTVPKVLCCLKEWRGCDNKVVIAERENLIVKGIQKSLFKSKKGIKVFSLLTKQTFVLAEDCTALFSTRPSLVKMMVTDILDHVVNPFPSGARLFFNNKVFQDPVTAKKVHNIPEALLSKGVNMVEVMEETSLIASTLPNNSSRFNIFSNDDNPYQMIDIPLEGGLLDVEVALIKVNEAEKLYDDTINIYMKYDPLAILPIRETNSDGASLAQALFYSAVRPGWETHGIQFDKPMNVYEKVSFDEHSNNGSVSRTESQLSSMKLVEIMEEPSQNDPLLKKSSSERDEDERPEKEEKLDQSSLGVGQRYREHVKLPDVVESRNRVQLKTGLESNGFSERSFGHFSPDTLQEDDLKGDIPFSKVSIGDNLGLEDNTYDDVVTCAAELTNSVIMKLSHRVGELELRLAALESLFEDTNLRDSIHIISDRLQVLESMQTSLYAHQMPHWQDTGTPDAESRSSVNDNRYYLKGLSTQHILELLDAMDLGRYKDVFAQEQIAGDVLLELNEEILKEELGIESKLHWY